MREVTHEQTVSIDMARQMDSICQRFETEWLAGKRPWIEAFVLQAESVDRAPLLGELVRLEAGLRHDQGEAVAAEEYQARFPLDVETVSLALQEVLKLAVGGDRAGRYVLLEEIGRGGMGAVYRATDLQLRRRVAVKVLLPQHRDVPEAARRLEEESKICAGLQHPGVPPVHELGRLDDDRPFLAMKLVEGTTLAEKLDERPDPRHVLTHWLSVFEQICQTVAYAHTQGVIHRDLKPSNVMVGAFGEVQIMDWGLAKRVQKAEGGSQRLEGEAPRDECMAAKSDVQDPQFTRAGDLLGTPAYVSPEQAHGQIDTIDQRTDVFALGAILCKILTGEPVYVGQSTRELIEAARRADLSGAMRRVRECGASDELIELCLNCLAPRPEQRPQDALQVCRRMSAHLEGVAERLQQAVLTQARAEVEQLARRRRQRLWMGSISVVLVLLAAIAAGSLLAAAHFRRMEIEQHALAGSNASLAQENTIKRSEAEAALAQAEQSDRQSRQTLADMYRASGELDEDQHRMQLAALWFCETARLAKGYDERRQRLNGVRALNAMKMCPQPIGMLDLATDYPDRLIFHPSNRWLVIKPKHGTAADALWNLDSGELHHFSAELGEVTALAWNPDGDRLAVGTRDGRVQVLDFPSLDMIALVDLGLPQRMMIRDLEYSSSGSRLAAVVKQQVFVTAESDLSASPSAVVESASIHGVAFSPDNQHLITLGDDKLCRVYSLTSLNSPPREIPHMADENLDWRICRPVFDVRGRLITIADKICWTDLATGAQQQTAFPSSHLTFQVIDLPQRDAICVMHHHGAFLCRPDAPAEQIESRSILSGVVRPTTQTLILGGAAPELKQLPPGEDQLRSYPIFTSDRVRTMALSGDGQFLATSDYSNRIIVWKLPATTPFHDTIPAGASDSCGWPRSDSRRVLIRRTHENAQVYLLEDGSRHGPPLVPDGTLIEAAWSADEQSAITLARRDGASPAALIDVWDWRTSQRRQATSVIPVEPSAASLRGIERLSNLAIRPAGDYIAYVARDGRVIVVNLSDPQQWHATVEHDYDSVFARADFDGLILSANQPQLSLRRMDWLEPQVRGTVETSNISGSSFSPDGKMIALSLDNSVMLVDAGTLRPICDPLPHPSWAYVVAMSDNGQFIATTCNDGYVRVWDTQTQELTCPTIRNGSRQLALTPDGGLLIAPAYDDTCRVIDTRTGFRICPQFPLSSHAGLTPRGNHPTRVSPDGRYVVSGGTENICIIDLDRVLPDEPADLERCLMWCELVSGHRFQQSKPVVLTPQQRLERWQAWLAF